MHARRWLGILFRVARRSPQLLFAIPFLGVIAIVWFNFFLAFHPLFGYLALLGCAGYIARRWEALLKKPFFTDLNVDHLVLAIIILVSLFVIGFNYFAWCLNPPNGVNC